MLMAMADLVLLFLLWEVVVDPEGALSTVSRFLRSVLFGKLRL